MRVNRTMSVSKNRRIIVATGVVLALSLFGLSTGRRLWLGSARLVSIEEIPEIGDACYRPVMADLRLSPSPEESLFSAFEPISVHAQDSGGTVDATRPPVRQIVDTAPIYSSVGVDTQRNEVYLQDSNLWSIRVFSRLDNAKPGDPPTEPRRIIKGANTALQFNSCVWVDPGAGDVYSVE